MNPLSPDAQIHLLRFPDLAEEPDALVEAFFEGEGIFEDAVLGPDGAWDRACIVALIYKQPVVLWNPQTQVVVSAVMPSQITLH